MPVPRGGSVASYLDSGGQGVLRMGVDAYRSGKSMSGMPECRCQGVAPLHYVPCSAAALDRTIGARGQAGLTAPPAAQFPKVAYEIQEASSITDDCDCGQPTLQVPVSGTYLLSARGDS
jgi:hypothetical protein